MNYKFDGSRVFHMNETIIANWNSVVGPDDIIFHLGDFCLGDSAEWINVLNRLNGKIYLIAGNHDIKDLRQNYTMYLANLHTSFLCNLIYPTFSRILLYSC